MTGYSPPHPEAVLRRIAELWDAGVSTAQIGAKIGISKNAVVGVAHRLGLTPRASPIPQRSGTVREPRVAKRVPPEARTIPALACAAPEPAVAAPGRVHACTWPESDRRPWRFCDAPVAFPGCSFCERHGRRAFNNWPPPRPSDRS